MSNGWDESPDAWIAALGEGGDWARQNVLDPALADGTTCNSACALAWLGGKERFMGKDSNIGFHAARVGTTHEISSVGNAMIGAYLAQVGIKEMAAIAFLTKAPPESMERLDLSNAIRYHISAKAFSFSQDGWSWANQAFQHPATNTSPTEAATAATAIGTTGRIIRWNAPVKAKD